MHGFANVLVQLYSDPPPSNVDVRGTALGNALLIKCFLVAHNCLCNQFVA